MPSPPNGLLMLAAGSVDISHEALLTAWPLLRDTWLAENHADRIVRIHLRIRRSRMGTPLYRDPSYLFSGTLLQAVTDTARIGTAPAWNPPLSHIERDFLDANDRARRRTARWRRR